MAGVGIQQADVIFAALPAHFELFARTIRKCGIGVYYLSLSSPGQPVQAERLRASALREAGIVPLPLESAPRLIGVLDGFNDPGKKSQAKADQLAPDLLLRAFGALYPNNADIAAKLHVAVQSMHAAQAATVGRVNCWAKAHPDRKHWLIYPGSGGLLVFDLVSNVRLLLVPLGALGKVVSAIKRIARKLTRVFARDNAMPQVGHVVAAAPGSSHFARSRVVFVTHDGLSYGDLFQKTLFYSDRPDSELHPQNLLHFDYCGIPSPSEKLRWVCLRSKRQSPSSVLYHVLRASGRGIVHVRSIPQLVGLLLLSRLYASFRFYLEQLDAFPELKVALIDYEILCPMTLLLAFDAKKIKAVAAQERFSGAFYATKGGAVLDTYLVGSEHAADLIRNSPAFHANHYLPVGQYRCDSLVLARKSPPPRILQEHIGRGRKVITALGFHTHMDWYKSECDPLLNWSAHRHFLEDMIRLSREVRDTFIVLRFKMVDWISLPAFTEAVAEIESLENITISVEYEKSFFSYDLCAHSALVIAKHTSLGDECLAVGIPVLFHEYTHNTERLVADAYDYSPARIMCFNYRELLERAQVILGSAPNPMAHDYEYLRTVVFGGLGDGKVRERIHAQVESLLR